MLTGPGSEGEQDNSFQDGAMFRVLKTQRARRSAVAAISPFVKRSRAAREIPDSLWFEPYFVGFMGMLITLMASRDQSLDTDDLAAVQSGSWAAITGMRADLIGDEICSLSADHDVRFELGCRNALSFFQVLQSGEAMSDLFQGRPEDPEQQLRTAHWSRHFDAYVNDYMITHMR
jgi:hypothetical protein